MSLYQPKALVLELHYSQICGKRLCLFYNSNGKPLSTAGTVKLGTLPISSNRLPPNIFLINVRQILLNRQGKTIPIDTVYSRIYVRENVLLVNTFRKQGYNIINITTYFG